MISDSKSESTRSKEEIENVLEKNNREKRRKRILMRLMTLLLEEFSLEVDIRDWQGVSREEVISMISVNKIICYFSYRC